MAYPKLEKEMKIHKENQEDLGKLLKIPQPSVSMRLNKQRDFRISEVYKIMKHYQKKFEELF